MRPRYMAPQGCDRARLRIFFGLVVLVSSLWLMIADIQAQSLVNQAAVRLALLLSSMQAARP